ncbi:hypothetical protein KVT40_004812 [Elsinoe batatas]|uniref:Uncharacterized protein n=1 Tax=Elsinoe batatas TaxID=2601811 RepID=A0A8K0PJ39_9PEZI|nr:hypothetical protein KVT40_004812 [Elsinoe batatas]
MSRLYVIYNKSQRLNPLFTTRRYPYYQETLYYHKEAVQTPVYRLQLSMTSSPSVPPGEGLSLDLLDVEHWTTDGIKDYLKKTADPTMDFFRAYFGYAARSGTTSDFLVHLDKKHDKFDFDQALQLTVALLDAALKQRGHHLRDSPKMEAFYEARKAVEYQILHPATPNQRTLQRVLFQKGLHKRCQDTAWSRPGSIDVDCVIQKFIMQARKRHMHNEKAKARAEAARGGETARSSPGGETTTNSPGSGRTTNSPGGDGQTAK